MLAVYQSLPDERLRPFVHSYVQRESRLHGAELVEPVVARLGSILEFQFAEPYDVPLYGIEKPNPSVPITVIGPITERRARIVMRGHVEALSILFQPLGLHTLFGVPVSLLADLGFEGHSILGRAVSELYERLGNTNSFLKRTQFLNSFFASRLELLASRDSASAALRLLMFPGSLITVSDVARRAGLSARQLERHALQRVGMPPQKMMRISRFQQAMRLKLEDGSNWTEVAYAAEYHDQMHMIRDFYAFAGDSPVRTLKQSAPDHLGRLGLRHK